MIEILKAKLQELNNLSQSLNDQLEQLRQQLNERPPRYFVESLVGSSSDSEDDDVDFVDFLSEDTSQDSFADSLSNHSGGTAVANSGTGNETSAPLNDTEEAGTVSGADGADVVEQVERTVVNSLFELSSRLEIVRNQMRAVLNSGHVEDHGSLSDDVRIPAEALEALVNNSRTVNLDRTRGTENDVNENVADNNNSLSTNAEEENRLERASVASDLPESDTPSPLPSSHDSENSSHFSFDSTYLTPVNRSPASSIDCTTNDTPFSNYYEQDISDDNVTEQHHVVLTQPPESPSVSITSSTDLSSVEDDEIINDQSNTPTITSPRHDDSYLSEFRSGTVTPATSPHREGWSPAFSEHRTHGNITSSPMASMPSPSCSAASINSLWTSPGSESTGEFRHIDLDSHSPSSANSPGNGNDKNQKVQNECDGSGSAESDSESANVVGGDNPDSEQVDEIHRSGDERLSRNNDGLDTSDDQDKLRSSCHSHQQEERGMNAETSQAHRISPACQSSSSLNFIMGRNCSNRQSTFPYHAATASDEFESDDNDYALPFCKSNVSNTASTAVFNDNLQSVGSTTFGGVNIAGSSIQVSRCEPDSTQEVTGLCQSHTSTSGSASSTPVNYCTFTDSSESNDSDSMKYITRRLRKDSRQERNKTCTETLPGQGHGKLSSSDGGFGTHSNSRSRQNCLTERRTKRDRDSAMGCSEEKRNKKRRPGNQSSKTHSHDFDVTDNRSHRNENKRNNSRGLKRTSTISSDGISQDPNGQSLNVKIDLSLINYSGPLAADSGSHTVPATRVLRSSTVSSYSGSSRQSRQVYKNSNLNSGDLTHVSGQPDSHSQRRSQQYVTRTHNYGSVVNRNLNNSSNQDNSTTHCDEADEDESSDESWQPGSNPESDTTITEEEQYETDSSYEVQVPKSTAALLDEYASDSSDTTWTVGMS